MDTIGNVNVFGSII